ncbi:MAG TPA: sigma-70 family RNA polymerase sigma factor [Spirochaetia bacterium]
MSAETQKKRIAGFFASEWSRLVGYVRAWIDDAADRDAEDMVQDLVESMFERADDAQPVEDLSAYIYRSLRNRIVDAYRRKRRTEELPEDLADMAPLVEEELEADEERDALLAAIDELPAAQREVLVATELEGRSFKELAAEWNVPIGTLLARKHRAVNALRETLTGGNE